MSEPAVPVVVYALGGYGRGMGPSARATSETADGARAGSTPLVDPRAPRFGQAITATALLGAVALREPLLVYAVAVVLLAAVVSRWRLHLYGALWRAVAVPFVGRPAEPEPAAPHRFAQVLGAAGTTVASGLLLSGGVGTPTLAVVGFAIAGLVAALAGLAAATGVCVGCRLYRQVALFRRLGLV